MAKVLDEKPIDLPAKVLKCEVAEKAVFDGYTFDCNRLELVQDDLGNYIVGKQVLNDPAFAAIRDKLIAMVEIDYKPKLAAVESVEAVEEIKK